MHCRERLLRKGGLGALGSAGARAEPSRVVAAGLAIVQPALHQDLGANAFAASGSAAERGSHRVPSLVPQQEEGPRLPQGQSDLAQPRLVKLSLRP
jgi:hypothetical protein